MSEQQPTTPEQPEPDKYQFPGAIDRDRLRTEQPIDPMINSQFKRPNPLDPMGNIEMDGRALRTLASGRVPLWIVMVGWGTIGLGSFLLFGVAMREIVTAFREGDRGGELLATAFAFAPMILVTLLIITILFRATWRHR